MFHDINHKLTNKGGHIELYIKENLKVNPHKEAFFIMSIFFIFGVFWVGFSDQLLQMFVKNIDIYIRLQTFKGWIFILLNTILIYGLVKNRASLFQKSIYKINSTYEDLQTINNELLVTKQKLENTAYHDSVTGLLNRLGLEQQINKFMADGSPFAMIHIGLDNFRYINDTLGHSVGDMFLSYIGNRLKNVVQPPNIVGRLDGDKFAIILTTTSKTEAVKKKLQTISELLGKTWIKDNYNYSISISAGIVLFPRDGSNKDILFRNANLAMNAAKKEGKGKKLFYKNEMLNYNSEKFEMVCQIRNAIESEGFSLYYQPQINLTTGEITGVEALIRLQNQEKEFISPKKFIPLAEETGQIFGIEKWVFESALRQKKVFEEEGFRQLQISINLSSSSLISDENFWELEKLIGSFEIDFSHITIEITETALLTDITFGTERLNRLKRLGVKIALDDFGTGYSSLTHLKNFPIDTVKLDKSFIKSIEEKNKDNLIIKSIISLSRALNYQVIAEGIETKDQFFFLKKNRCQNGQGFLMSRPLPIEEIVEKLKGSYRYQI